MSNQNPEQTPPAEAPPPADGQDRSTGYRRFAVGLALWLAVLLCAGRLLVVYLLDTSARDVQEGIALWRLADDVEMIGLHALLAALLTALLCAWRGARKGSDGGVASDIFVVLVGAAAVLSVLSGWPIDDPAHIPGLDSELGRGFLYASSALGLVATLLLLAILRAAHRRPASQGRHSRLWLDFGIVVAVGFPVLFSQAYSELPDYRTVRRVVHEIAFDPGSWNILESNPEHRPKLGVLTTALDYRVDGGDLPALVMPPPCTIAYTVPDVEGDLFLNGRAGLDVYALGTAKKIMRGDYGKNRRLKVRMQVLIDGEVVFDELRRRYDGQPQEERVWRTFGGQDGIRVGPGQVVEFRTSLVDPDPQGLAEVPLIQAGFGELTLERVFEQETERASPEAPNLVLIVMDTLRADRMSTYGYHKLTTPHLDRLAERGVLYEQARSTSSWTWPSTASILTGLAPDAHGVLSESNCYLSSQHESLPVLLEDRGYVTGAFTCNPLIVPNKNFDRGFEFFDSHTGFRKTNAVWEHMTEWLDQQDDARFFLYLHLVDTHTQYDLVDGALAVAEGEEPADYPEKGVMDYQIPLLKGAGHGPDGSVRTGAAVPLAHQKWMSEVYDAATFTADFYIGQVLAKLDELGLTENTIVAFTSDHGEEFLEHGLVMHGQSLHPELVHVPLIIAGPDIPAGLRIDTAVSNRHLAPTLARFGGANFKTLEDACILTELADLDHGPVYYSTRQGWWNGKQRTPIYGVAEGGWVLHWAPEGAPWSAGDQPGPEEAKVRLYDTLRDPFEARDLARQEPQRTARMLQLLQEHRERCQSRGTAVELGAGAADLAKLKALQYAGTGEEDEGEDPDASPQDGH